MHERSGVIRVFPFTSLQILTQEDWNVVLYNGMASTSSWAALYFVALMTFGNYVLFNLLVAILVEGFQAEVRDLSRGRENRAQAGLYGSVHVSGSKHAGSTKFNLKQCR